MVFLPSSRCHVDQSLRKPKAFYHTHSSSGLRHLRSGLFEHAHVNIGEMEALLFLRKCGGKALHFRGLLMELSRCVDGYDEENWIGTDFMEITQPFHQFGLLTTNYSSVNSTCDSRQSKSDIFMSHYGVIQLSKQFMFMTRNYSSYQTAIKLVISCSKRTCRSNTGIPLSQYSETKPTDFPRLPKFKLNVVKNPHPG